MAKTKKNEAITGNGDSLITQIQKEINDSMSKFVAYNLEVDDPLEIKQ